MRLTYVWPTLCTLQPRDLVHYPNKVKGTEAYVYQYSCGQIVIKMH